MTKVLEKIKALDEYINNNKVEICNAELGCGAFMTHECFNTITDKINDIEKELT